MLIGWVFMAWWLVILAGVLICNTAEDLSEAQVHSDEEGD